MQNLYTSTSIDKLICELTERGYEAVNLRDGVLTSGDWVLIAPDDKHYNFVIRDVFINEWSAAQTVRRCAKISKALQSEIEAARFLNEQNEEVECV